MKPSNLKGFTLIELMITIAIISLLAAIAAPNYSNYILHAKLTEGINHLSQRRSELEVFYAVNKKLPENEIDYFKDEGQDAVVYLVRWSPYRYALEVWYGKGLGASLDRRILWLVPTIMDSGGIRWHCQNHTEDYYKMPSNAVPASCS